MSSDLEGRTIARVEQMGDYSGLRLHFTDGTYAEMEGGGYESSEVSVDLFTPEKHRRRAQKEQGARERRRVHRLLMSTRQSSKPEMHGLMNVVYSYAQMADLLYSSRPLLVRDDD